MLKQIICGILLLAFTIVFPERLAALTMRVDQTSGVPRILKNGSPIRSRIFYGDPQHSMPFAFGAGKSISGTVFAMYSEPDRGMMVFTFGNKASEIILDDIRVTDVETGREVIALSDFEQGQESFTREWKFWPTDAQNTVGTVAVVPGAGRDGSGGLKITLKDPPNGKWPAFNIHHEKLSIEGGHQYRVEFWARAEPEQKVNIRFTRPVSWNTLAGSLDLFISQVKLAATAGVDMVSFETTLPWPEPGKQPDFNGYDNLFKIILEANPNALLIPRIKVNNPPEWWVKANPNEMMRWEGERAQARDLRSYACVASKKYRADAAKHLTALITHVEERFGEHAAGYHPTGQGTHEWYFPEATSALNGYSLPELAAWHDWLTARYGTDRALRAAWSIPDAAIVSAAVPTSGDRRASPGGIFRDPKTERAVIDFTEFQSQMMADCILDFARVVRTSTKGKKLSLFYYGYSFEWGYSRLGPGSSGHYKMRHVLSSPDIDILCSPMSYQDRALGGSSTVMTAAESISLAGKMYLNEDDTATHLAPVRDDHPVWKVRANSVEESLAIIMRNLSQASLRNFAQWWVDLSAEGQFNDPKIWDIVARMRAVEEPMMNKSMPFRPSAAVVINESSMMHLAAGADIVGRPGVYESRAAIGRIGVPYGQYLMDDVIAGRVPAKLYVLMTPWVLTAEERRGLMKAIAGSTRVWCYAPGYIDGNRTSPEAMRELTGFSLVQAKRVMASTTERDPLQWPERWHVFGPFSKADGTPDNADLAHIPDTLRIGTHREETRIVATNGNFDYAKIFAVIPKDGLSAYAFAEVESSTERTVQFNAGADWWMQWWVNGESVFDTLAKGNGAASLGIQNHSFRVKLKEGKNIIAVRVASGTGGFKLFSGGPNELDELNREMKAFAEPTDAGRKLGLIRAFGVNAPIKPFFTAADAKPEETLAVYPDGSAAIAMRRTSNGISLFVGVPGLTPELMRIAARAAGCHLYTQVDCNVYANGPFVALHAAEDGPLDINMGHDGPVYDVMTGEIAGTGPHMTLPIKRGETRLFRLRE
ncbi:MAG: beta-galactosidase [Spirochaetota bacterium]